MDTHVNILGILVPKLTMDRAIERIELTIEQDGQELCHVITLNPEIAMACQHDASLRTIVDEAGLLTADGIGIVMVSRLRGTPLPERVTGCDMLYRLLERGNEKGWSFYLLGANETTSALAADVIRRDYPNVSILGRHHGFFKQEEEGELVEEIGVLKPDILVVALGAPYAERWIHKYKGVLHAKIAIGVGGSLDVVAGTVPRAPMVWRKLNIEWLFRLLNQPSRWRRQLLLPRFAWKALVYRDK